MPTDISNLGARNKALKIEIVNKNWSLLFFVIFSIGCAAYLVIDYIDDQVTADIHVIDTFQITELTAENEALKERLDNITGRTFQLWLSDENELIPIGSTYPLETLIPAEDNELYTGNLGNNVGFTGNRTDIYIHQLPEK